MVTKDDFNQFPTLKDLEILHRRIINDVKVLLDNRNPNKEFYSPKEFCAKTGLKYSTVIAKCKMGLLKARQDAPNSCWQIHSSAIEKYKKEATEDFVSE